ncbi:hypothetical protein A8135_02030 [Legionella jamestowniensis]|uniref:Nucleotidyl transferase AbiEii/AbiGii toxin family protein n=1 Tax=Legionella jamestowniensis TaxID=455 RepID=A0ABX2XUC0_9GAMM|nr:nucleotidyl transferase AbiEii/AbiGii toxin family protein [Legionella jamestowniensis]OCH98022.1 hypothetical protein A8135_02030 [Legionella jamestowniensis]
MVTYDEKYLQQIALMTRLLTSVKRESCFALKGGTAINLFIHDLPRLSIDIDLTYLPYQPREISLITINDSLIRIADDINLRNKGISILFKKNNDLVQKLIVGNVERIIIEPNEILRGNLYPIELRNLCPKAESLLGITLNEIPTLSYEEIYAGKICAALDRQHPRDLFDILYLYQTTGITTALLDAFVVYLACCSRPIHELLNPKQNISEDNFKREFFGMTNRVIKFKDLIQIWKQLIQDLHKNLNDHHKRFLISIKEGTPEYKLLPFSNLEDFPALQWKLFNINKMTAAKKQMMLKKLHEIFL